MSRLRSTLSTHPTDKIIQRKVDDARRILLGALQLCDEVAKKEPLLNRQARGTREDITRSLYALDRVRRIQSVLEDVPVPARERKPKKESELPVLEEDVTETI